jgi:hypothetical protein
MYKLAREGGDKNNERKREGLGDLTGFDVLL